MACARERSSPALLDGSNIAAYIADLPSGGTRPGEPRIEHCVRRRAGWHIHPFILHCSSFALLTWINNVSVVAISSDALI
jgi:hypothetical protein